MKDVSTVHKTKDAQAVVSRFQREFSFKKDRQISQAELVAAIVRVAADHPHELEKELG